MTLFPKEIPRTLCFVCTLVFNLAQFMKRYVRRAATVAVHLKLKEIKFQKMFFFSNSKVCKRLPKQMPNGKKSQICKKKSCQIALFSPKSATESLKPTNVLCFQLLIFFSNQGSGMDYVVSVLQQFLHLQRQS